MKNIGLIFLSLSFALIGVLGFIVGNNFYEAYKQSITDKARHDCAQIARVEVVESEEIKGFYPEKNAYENCLAEKGIN